MNWCPNRHDAAQGCYCEESLNRLGIVVGGALNSTPGVWHHLIFPYVADFVQRLGVECRVLGIQPDVVLLNELPVAPPLYPKLSIAYVVGMKKVHLLVPSLPLGAVALSVEPSMRVGDQTSPGVCGAWQGALRSLPAAAGLRSTSQFKSGAIQDGEELFPGQKFRFAEALAVASAAATADAETSTCEFKLPSSGVLSETRKYLQKFLPVIRQSSGRTVHLLLGIHDKSRLVIGMQEANEELSEALDSFFSGAFPLLDPAFLTIRAHPVALPSDSGELVRLSDVPRAQAFFAISCLSGHAWFINGSTQVEANKVDLLVNKHVLDVVSCCFGECRDLANFLPDDFARPNVVISNADRALCDYALAVALALRNEKSTTGFDWLNCAQFACNGAIPLRRYVYDLAFAVPESDATCLVHPTLLNSAKSLAYQLHRQPHGQKLTMPLFSIWLRARPRTKCPSLQLFLSETQYRRVLVVNTHEQAQLARQTLEVHTHPGAGLFDHVVVLQEPQTINHAQLSLVCHPTQPRCFFVDADLLHDPTTIQLFVVARSVSTTPPPAVVALCTLNVSADLLRTDKIATLRDAILYDEGHDVPFESADEPGVAQRSLCSLFDGRVELMPLESPAHAQVNLPRLVREWVSDAARPPPSWELVRSGAVVVTENIQNTVDCIRRSSTAAWTVVHLQKMQPGCGASAALRATGYQLRDTHDVYCVRHLDLNQVQAFWQRFPAILSRPTLLLLDEDMLHGFEFETPSPPPLLRHPVVIVRVVPPLQQHKRPLGLPNPHIVQLRSKLTRADTKEVCLRLHSALSHPMAETVSNEEKRWIEHAREALDAMAGAELAPDDRHLYIIGLSACRGEFIPAATWIGDLCKQLDPQLRSRSPTGLSWLLCLARLLAFLSAFCQDIEVVLMAMEKWTQWCTDPSASAQAFVQLVHFDGRRLRFLHPFLARLFLSVFDDTGSNEHWKEDRPVPASFLLNEWKASFPTLCEHLNQPPALCEADFGSDAIQELLSRRDSKFTMFPPLVQHIVRTTDSTKAAIRERLGLLNHVLAVFDEVHQRCYPRLTIEPAFQHLIRSRALRYWGRMQECFLADAVSEARIAFDLLKLSKYELLARNNLATAPFAMLFSIPPEPLEDSQDLKEFREHSVRLLAFPQAPQVQRYINRLRDRGYQLDIDQHMPRLPDEPGDPTEPLVTTRFPSSWKFPTVNTETNR